MSIKASTGRKLSSPQNIKVPEKYLNDFQDVAFFEEIKSRMYEMYSILKSTNEVTPLTGGTYTTTGNEILVAENDITVTLRNNPIDQERVQLKNIGGIITIDGNGRQIDGSNQLIVDKLYDAPTVIYLKNQDSWFIF